MIGERKVPARHVLIYSASRYIEFFIKFMYGVVVAKLLGPYMFGVWGFILLIQQYLLYTSLGLQFAVTVELSNKTNPDLHEEERLIAHTLGATAIVSIILISIGLVIDLWNIELFPRYAFEQYALMLAILASVMHFVNILINAYRVSGKVLIIAAVQLIRVVVPFAAAFLFSTDNLILALLASTIVANGIGLLLLSFRAPFRIYMAFDRQVTKELLKLSIPLLIYNVSFYLIMISARTILSIFYTVEEMGYYTLANSITNATLLGFKSILFVALPEVIFRTRQDVDDSQARETVNSVNMMYGNSVFLAVFIVIILLPALFFILPDYQSAEKTIAVLLLAQAVLATTLGYNAIALARGYQLQVAKISLQVVLIITILGLIVATASMDYTWISMSVLVGSFVYAVLQARLGSALMNAGQIQPDYLANVLPPGHLAAIAVLFIGIMLGHTTIGGYCGLVLFVIFSRKHLVAMWQYGKQRFVSAS